jgi:hypothetical protein
MAEKLVLADEPGKISGYKVRLGSIDYIVPPLNIKGVEKHEETIRKVDVPRLLDGKPNPEALTEKVKLGLICEIILTALQRNYPEKDLEFVKEWVDLRNVYMIFDAVMGMSGYGPGEPPGEAKAT